MRVDKNNLITQKPKIRCAIYTRKSREDGLDQSFNSLDNQRLAAENYIASQVNEGWVLIPDRYDDGAYSGGDTDRPAFQRMVSDIKEGKINCVVVYKVERISRSNSDFVRMIELFDKYKVNFVSVTESFNTGTASGRLMLGMLINFAQYERELCSERVKHKISASKKKGLWMGGTLPLGYNSKDAQLIINEEEAKIVRNIFEAFIKTESCFEVATELNNLGYSTKKRNSAKHLGGGDKFHQKNIRRILENPVYAGFVSYEGQLYDGVHEPIIDKETWQKVQDIFNHRPINKVITPESRLNPAPILKGLITCSCCNSKMIPTYTKKNNKRYRYYICQAKTIGKSEECEIGRVSASEIEDVVVGQILEILKKPEFVAGTIGQAMSDRNNPSNINESSIIAHFQQIGKVWDGLFLQEQARIINLLVESVLLKTDGINIRILKDGLNLLSDELV